MNEEEFNKLVEMFETDGWKMYISQLSEARESLVQGAPTACLTNDDWQVTRGQIIGLSSCLNYEQFIRVSYENQQLEDEDVSNLI